MAASMLIYDYSTPERISDETPVTLLSEENRRLNQRDGRYLLFNGYGELYIDHANLADFKEKFAHILTENHPKKLIQDAPNLPIIIELINEVKKMGLTVVGSRQIGYKSWDIADWDALLYNLQTTGTNIDQAFTVQRQDDKDMMVNSQNEVVLEKYHNSKEHFIWDVVFYDIIDSDGNIVISQIHIKKLAIVLLGLILKLRVENIKKMLLFSRISNDIITNPNVKLQFERHYRSDYRSISSITDIKILDNIPIVHDRQHSLNKFNFSISGNDITDTNPIAENDAENALMTILHDVPDHSARDAKKLSDWIIKTADKAHVFIQRRERRQFNICDINHFVIKNGQIDDLLANERPTEHQFPIETVFEVFDSALEESIRYDLSLDELVTYILSMLIKK